MTSPGIEIRWGSYDNENYGSFKITDPEQRTALRPKLHRAVDMAIDGLLDYEVEITDRKYLDVYKVRPRYGIMAAATTSKRMQMFLRPHQLGGHLDVGYAAHAILHEGLHAIRMETIPMKSIGERSATEGIAYVADYLFKKKVPHWKYKQTSVVERVMALPKRDITRHHKKLAAIHNADLSSPESDFWLMAQLHGNIKSLSTAEIVGINTVYRQVQAGRTIGELLHLSTSEVLGFESAT